MDHRLPRRWHLGGPGECRNDVAGDPGAGRPATRLTTLARLSKTTQHRGPIRLSIRTRRPRMMLRLAAPLGLVLALAIAAPPKAEAADPALGHMVYFKLKDGSLAARDKLVAACK